MTQPLFQPSGRNRDVVGKAHDHVSGACRKGYAGCWVIPFHLVIPGPDTWRRRLVGRAHDDLTVRSDDLRQQVVQVIGVEAGNEDTGFHYTNRSCLIMVRRPVSYTHL